jgi:hypothetical protein
MQKLKSVNAFTSSETTGLAAPFPLVSHILEQAYSRSVAPHSHLLNSYEGIAFFNTGFSNNVYGEIKHSFVHDLILQAGIKEHHVFLDLGSGIGNVVLQVAAECLCESYGIEIMENPSILAKKQKNEFLSRFVFFIM